MKQTRNLSGIFAGIGLMLLIFDSKLAYEGARSGLGLCIRTVIPSLFPFVVISMLLIRSFAGNRCFHQIASFLGIPTGAESVLIPALFGGYPVGARCVYDLFKMGQLEKKQAERMLAFCNNAGPAFLFGMLSGYFPEQKTVWMLWIIHIASALLTGYIIPTVETVHNTGSRSEANAEGADVLLTAMKAMAQICAWIILFRILSDFICYWFLWLFPQWLQVLITGILELTNGCCELAAIENIEIRFLLCSCMLAMGGFCVLLQTVSVTKGLSPRYYLLGKGFQTLFSLLLCCAVLWRYGWIIVLIMLMLIVPVRKSQKKCRNPVSIPV